MDVNGTVNKIRYRDGRYVIATVVVDGRELTCKGESDTIVIGMPFVAKLDDDQADRARGGVEAEAQELTIVHVEPPGPSWSRLAGVASYLRSGGVVALEGAGYQLVTTFRTDLPGVLIDTPERLAQIRALGPGLDAVRAELDKARVALVCAADLGEQGYEWLVGICTRRYGPAGPVIVAEDIGSIVADGVAGAADVAGLATTRSDKARLLSAGLSLERARVGRRGATPRLASDYAKALFDGEGAGLVNEAIGDEILVRRGHALVSAVDDGALRVVESEIARLVESARPGPGGRPEITAHRERAIATNLSDSPVSIVETPAGASGSWLTELLGHARAAGASVSVLYPDLRGHLLGGWEPGRVVDDPDVVVMVDAHRLDYDEMARRLLGVADGARLVVAGDRFSFAPCHGGNLVRELISTAVFPCVGLDGSGAAWGLRCGETIERCVEVRYGRAPAGSPVVWSGAPTSLSRHSGKRAMLDRTARGIGAGALGTVVTNDTRARTVRLELDDLDAADFSSSYLVGGDRIPVSHLSGVRTAALGLGRKIAPAQLYAAITAAKVLYVRDEDFLRVDAMTEQKTALLDLGGDVDSSLAARDRGDAPDSDRPAGAALDAAPQR